ncbi:protein-disulfide reductase DsbD [Thauera sp. SDU_THAU2]|uniref:protein-disulfide reductase DsbD n=1 Tax=Thauera sp. SDU_THAU2 TaxID=3136633 RepID=UPI00311EAF30
MSLYRRAFAVFLLYCCAIGAAWANDGLFSWSNNTRGFLEAADVFRLDDVLQQGDSFTMTGHVADKHYVYRHSLRLMDGTGREIELDLPAGTAKHDEFFGDTEIYQGDTLRLHFPTATPGPVTLHWQGCAEAGICYPPQAIRVDLPATGQSTPAGASPPQEHMAPNTLAADLAEDQAAAQRLAALGPVAGILLFFGFGLLLAFTPCALPMIPIISTMIVGSQAKPRRAFLLSLSYVLAMAGTYAAVGVAAGLAGANLQATLQSPWLLGAFATLFLILASSLFGLFELQLPSALVDRVESAGRRRPGGSLAGASALGFLSALLVGPCMTAPLAGALLYIGQTGSALYGGLALFALGLGMGLPLLAIAVFGAKVLPGRAYG